MEWVNHVPRLPGGTLIKFRQGDLVGDLEEKEFRVLSVLGKGQNVVYNCAPVHHVPATSSSSHPLPSSMPTEHPGSSTIPVSLKRKSERKSKSGRFKKSKPSRLDRTRMDEDASVLSGSREGNEEEVASILTGTRKGDEEDIASSERKERDGMDTASPPESGTVPSSTFAIKVQFFKASEYKKDRALKGVWTEYSMMQELGEVATKALLCGWIMLKIPEDDLWTVGLFGGLVMPVYKPLKIERDANESETKALVLDAFQQLRKFHQAGYVHGDVKMENFLVREGKVVVADVEGCCKEGQPLKDFVATPLYASISTLGHFLACSEETTDSVVNPIIPTAANKGMDYWSFGMMILEIYSPDYLKAHFPIEALMDKLKVKADELEVLEQIRKAYTKIYDDHAWQTEIADVHEDIKQLLHFCLQRPSDCGLLGRDAIDAEVSPVIASPVFGTVDSTQKKAIGGIAKLYSERRPQPPLEKPEGSSLRLPWGGCTLIPTHGGKKFTMEVPGVLQEEDDFGEAEWVFRPCPVQHSQGYIMDHRVLFRCGKCKAWTNRTWDLVKSHTRACCDGLDCRKAEVLGD